VKQNTVSTPSPSERAGVRLIRYQLHNNIGSAALELDGTAQVISYEEYHPYGTTAYQANSANIKAAAKRYRYTGMERDEETGLAYHNARYYAPWLGRWISSDPIGLKGGLNLYSMVSGNPILLVDTHGTSGEETKIVKPEMATVYPKNTVRNFTVKVIDPATGKSFVQIIDVGVPAQNEFMHYQMFIEEKGVPKSGGKPSTQTTGQKTFHKLVKSGVEVEVISESAAQLNLKKGERIFLKEGQNFSFTDTQNLAAVKEGTGTVYNTTPKSEFMVRRTLPSGEIQTFQSSLKPKLSMGGVSEAAGITLSVMSIPLVIMDALSFGREQRIKEQGIEQSPAVFYDDRGGFRLESRGFFFDSYYKVYVGASKGIEKEIEEDMFKMYEDIAEKRWGYIDWKGDIVQGEKPWTRLDFI
jgi:RHS repeat-associated protein